MDCDGRVRKLGVVLLAIALGVSATLIDTATAEGAVRSECASIDVWTAGCPVVDANLDSNQVNLIGTTTTPGDAGDGRNVRNPIPGGAAARNDTCAIPRGTRCYGTVPRTGTPAAATAPTPSVTLRDLAAFRPAPGTQQMEPNGWVVPGLDANFYAIIGQQLVPGTLLGQLATVRFTPVAYHWNYGDGQAVIRSTKGGTWDQLGLQDFDPTPTSHVYDTEGEYIIRLTIDFRAEYQFGSGAFRPVVGTIALPANDLRVTVTGAKTVLVDRDCVANPSGPGC